MIQKVGVKAWTGVRVYGGNIHLGWEFNWQEDRRVRILMLFNGPDRASVYRSWRLGRKKMSDAPLRAAPLNECFDAVEFWSRQLPITWIKQKHCRGRLNNINLAATATTHYHLPGRRVLDSEHADAP